MIFGTASASGFSSRPVLSVVPYLTYKVHSIKAFYFIINPLVVGPPFVKTIFFILFIRDSNDLKHILHYALT